MEKRGSTTITLAPLRHGFGEVLHHRVARVLADVAADQRQAAQPVPVHRFVAADRQAVGEFGGLFARDGAEADEEGLAALGVPQACAQ